MSEINQVDSPTSTKYERTRRARLRRMAARQGFRLAKSRRRDPMATDFGGWFLTNTTTNVLEAHEHGVSLDDVERFLHS